ncbi:hypothetical protein [Lysinibacillus sp. NPDC047702]|uniref:hypothetical protein n=1 Tax=unclassified Lysinibacillus TaxID=2636778 RepID=UPI003D0630EB
MRGRCIKAPEKSNLVEGEIYYLFQHGGLAYNVSRFPHPGAHFGTYQKSRFELVDTAVEVQSKYLARVVKPPSHFYKIGEEYIITEPRANGYYDVFLKTRPNVAPVGSYKNTSCFECIEPFETVVVNDMPKMVQKKVEMVHAPIKKQVYEQLSLF